MGGLKGGEGATRVGSAFFDEMNAGHFLRSLRELRWLDSKRSTDAYWDYIRARAEHRRIFGLHLLMFLVLERRERREKREKRREKREERGEKKEEIREKREERR